MKINRRAPALQTAVNICGLLMFCGIFIVSFADMLSAKKNVLFPLLAIVLAIGFLLTVWLCGKLKNEKIFVIVLLSLSFVLKLFWISAVGTKPDSDFLILYNAGLKGASGDFSFNAETYYLMWPYQMGFTLYQSLVLFLFGGGTFPLKVLNCLFTTGTTLLVYKTGKLIFNRSSGKIGAVLYTLYIPCIVMNSVLSNQQLSTFLFYFGFYVMLKQFDRKKFSWLLTGLLFALGHIVRPLAIVVIPAVLLYQLIYSVLLKDKNAMLIVKRTVLALVVFFVAFQGISLALEETGISPFGFQNRDPLWKFVTGLNPDTSGQYSDPDIKYLKQFPLQSEERKAAETAMIKDRVSDFGKLSALLYKKYCIFWGTRDAFAYWALGTGHPTLSSVLGTAEQLMYLLVSLFGIVALVRLMKKRNVRYGFFIILMILYAGAHLLIEIQTRYREFVIPLMFMFLGYGIQTCLAFIKGKLRQKSGLAGK